jgi:RNA polymerase sigma factor (TIGR02999 family)
MHGRTDLIAPESPQTVTRLLADARRGDRSAMERLFPIVYDELRRAAGRQRLNWQGDLTLNTTALVHEAYLKLAGQDGVAATDRAHFMAVAATAMRHILCNYARDRRRQKRGGDHLKLSLDDLPELAGDVTFTDDHASVLERLDAALEHLASVDPRQAQVVECRFFGGMTIDDTAAAVGASPATVKREWALARARLYREMQRDGQGPSWG